MSYLIRLKLNFKMKYQLIISVNLAIKSGIITYDYWEIPIIKR